MQPAFAGQQVETGYQPTFRQPVFDVTVKPQKRSAYSRMAQNELAKELYQLGLFNPELAEQAMTCLEMMEFDGDEGVKQKVQQGHTLLNMVQGLQVQLQQLNAIIGSMTGRNVLAEMQMQQQALGAGQAQQQPQGNTGDSFAKKQEQATKASMTNYGEELAKRATPNMEG